MGSPKGQLWAQDRHVECLLGRALRISIYRWKTGKQDWAEGKVDCGSATTKSFLASLGLKVGWPPTVSLAWARETGLYPSVSTRRLPLQEEGVILAKEIRERTDSVCHQWGKCILWSWSGFWVSTQSTHDIYSRRRKMHRELVVTRNKLSVVRGAEVCGPSWIGYYKALDTVEGTRITYYDPDLLIYC